MMTAMQAAPALGHQVHLTSTTTQRHRWKNSTMTNAGMWASPADVCHVIGSRDNTVSSAWVQRGPIWLRPSFKTPLQMVWSTSKKQSLYSCMLPNLTLGIRAANLAASSSPLAMGTEDWMLTAVHGLLEVSKVTGSAFPALYHQH